MGKVKVLSGKMERRKASRARAGNIEYIMHWRRSSNEWADDLFETSRVLVRHHLGGGLFMDVPVDLPTEIETGNASHHEPRIGMQNSRKAAKLLGDMPGVHVPEEYAYDVDGQPRKKTVKVKGKSLYQVLTGLLKKDKKTEFTMEDAEKAFRLTRRALKKINQAGFCHGDLDGSNIILTKDPDLIDPESGIGIGLIDWAKWTGQFGGEYDSHDLRRIYNEIKEAKRDLAEKEKS